MSELFEDAWKWLRDEAAPLWVEKGLWEDGRCAERLKMGTASPINSDVGTRMRTQGRQIYAFTRLGEWGVAGAEEVARRAYKYATHESNWLDGKGWRGSLGSGMPAQMPINLYDQACMALGLARYGHVLKSDEAMKWVQRTLDVVNSRKYGDENNGDSHTHWLEAILEAKRSGATIGNDIRSNVFLDDLGHSLRGFRVVLDKRQHREWRKESREDRLGHSYEVLSMSVSCLSDVEKPVRERVTYLEEEVDAAGGWDEALKGRLWRRTERMRALAVTKQWDKMKDACLDLYENFLEGRGGLWRDDAEEKGWPNDEISASGLYHIVTMMGDWRASL